jgi:hypothetical protein
VRGTGGVFRWPGVSFGRLGLRPLRLRHALTPAAASVSRLKGCAPS